MDAYSKLGVELDIRFNQEFTQVIESLKTALENIKVDKLLDRLKKVEERMSGVGKASEAAIQNKATKSVEHLSKVFGLTTEQVKELQKQIGDTKSVEQFARGMSRVKSTVEDVAKAEKEAYAKQRENQEKLGSYLNAVEARRARGAREERARQEKLANDIMAIKKRQYDEEVKRANDLAALYRRNGMKQWNDGYVRNTAVVDVDQAHAMALQMQVTLQQRAATERRRIEEKLANDIMAIKKRQYDDEVKRANAINALYARNGMKQWNDGYVRRTAVTDVGQAHDMALRMNAPRPTGPADRGLSFTIGEMAKNLAKFYLVRQTMFAVANSIRGAVRETIELNQTLANAGAIANASADDLRMFEQTALQVSKASRSSAVEVAKMMQTLAQSGVSARDMPTVTRTVDRFVTGTGASPEAATKVFTTAMNVWKFKAEEASRVSSTLTAAMNNSKLQVGDLATSFNYLANQGAMLGMSIEEVTGLIAAMANQGMQASTIGTSMANFMARLVAPTKRMKDMFDKYKISLDDVNPRLHSFAEIIGVFEKKGVSIDDMFEALDKRVARGLVAALMSGKAGLEAMTASITGTNADLVAYDKSLAGAKAQLNMLNAEVVILVNSIGQSMSGALIGAVDLLKDLTVGMNTGTGKALAMGLAIGGLALGVAKLGAAIQAAFTAQAIANASGLLKLIGLISAHPLVALGIALAGVAGILLTVGNSARVTEQAMTSLRKSWVEAEEATMRGTSALIKLRAALENAKDPQKTHVDMNTELGERLKDAAKYYPKLNGFLGQNKIEYGKINDVLEEGNRLLKERNRLEMDKRIREFNDKVEDPKVRNQLTRIHTAEVELKRRTAKYDQANSKKLQAAMDALTPKERAVLRKLAEGEALKKRSTGVVSVPWAKAGSVTDIPTVIRHMVLTRAGGVTDRNSFVYIKPGSHQEVYYQAQLAKFMQEDLARKVDANSAPMNSTRDMQGRIAMPGYELVIDPKDPLGLRVLGVKEVAQEKPTGTPTPTPTGDGTKLSKSEQKRADTLEDRLAKREADIRARTLAYQRSVEERTMVDKYKSMEERHAAHNAALALIDQQQAEEITAKRLEIEKEFHDDKLVKGTDAHNRFLAIQLEGAEQVRRKFEAERAKVEDTFKKSLIVPLKFTAPTVDKQATYDQKGADRRAELAGKKAWTAQELHEIETKRLQDEEQILLRRQGAQESDIKQLEERIALLDGPESEAYQEHVRQLEEKRDHLQDITEQIALQRELLSERIDETPLSAFEQGARRVAQQVGRVNDGFALMGEKAMSFGTDGIADGLWSMVDALREGENAWKAFRQTMGQMLMDIGKDLTKYYIKLFMVWSIKQALGWVSGGGSSVSAPSEGAFNTDAVMATGNYGFLKKAEGGLIPADMGTPGVDSVPALLMPGEFVVRKSAVDYYGLDTFRKMNVKRFADGGYVGNGAGSIGGNSGEEETVTFQIVNVVDPRSIPKTTAEEIVNVISLDAMNNGAAIRTIKARIRG